MRAFLFIILFCFCGSSFSLPPPQKKTSTQEIYGYSILVGTMVLSAVGTTYLTAALPQKYKFLSTFVSQFATLGVFVFGAPIWEPISSWFRKKAFGMKTSPTFQQEDFDASFESVWVKTQENYSLNAQMSRNVINQFLILARQNFYEAHRAMQSNDPEYAADQVADAAARLKTYFREIEPSNPMVAQAIQSSFTNHIHVDQDFYKSVIERIRRLDNSFDSEDSQNYYQDLLSTWFRL